MSVISTHAYPVSLKVNSVSLKQQSPAAFSSTLEDCDHRKQNVRGPRTSPAIGLLPFFEEKLIATSE